MAMDDLKEQVQRAQRGDVEAFAELVRHYQGMAVGYAYAVLGDFHLAEDAAQEAFLDSYRLLGDLQRAEAFPGWLKRIVFKHCDRLTRRRPEQVSLENVGEPLVAEVDTAAALEHAEGQRQVREAIAVLPAAQRQVVSLFYIQCHTQSEIAAFLEVPLTTVKKRLHDARRKLRERMLDMVSETLRENGPDELFSQKVVAALRARPRPLEIKGHPLHQVWEEVQKALPDWQATINDEEIVDRGVYPSVQGAMDRMADQYYRVGGRKVLRSHMTHTTFQMIKGMSAPVQLLSAGRCFRGPEREDATRIQVFYQIEGICIEPGAGREVMACVLAGVLGAVLNNVELRWVDRSSDYVDEMVEVDGRLGEDWLNVAGGGVLKREMLVEAGYDPDEVSGYGFGVGLERIVQIRDGLEDVRALWRPPYVQG